MGKRGWRKEGRKNGTRKGEEGRDEEGGGSWMDEGMEGMKKGEEGRREVERKRRMKR